MSWVTRADVLKRQADILSINFDISVHISILVDVC